MKRHQSGQFLKFFYWFVTHAPEQIFLGVALATAGVAIGLWIIDVPAFLMFVGGCVACFGVSVALGYRRFTRWHRKSSDEKVLVIEGRGLSGFRGGPLLNAVPATISGERISYILDVRSPRGKVDLERPVQEVRDLEEWIHLTVASEDSSSVTLVYGGLTPVPVTFLTGLMMDDEGKTVVMDWDRSEEEWRTLDENDDGIRFEPFGFDDVTRDEVVVAVSASYLVKDEDLNSTFDLPVVKLNLSDVSSSHWSKRKQNDLAIQFIDVVKRLDELGVKKIHLVLAAQNSVVFNFGRRYDKRNLPNLVVYQFERGQIVRYPWGIEMPVSGVQEASIQYSGRA